MAPQQTRQWVLADPPNSEPIYEGDNATFKLVKTTLPELRNDQVLVKTLYLSNDPAQRGWIQAGVDPERLYVPPVAKNDPMRSYVVSEVIASTSADLEVGQLVSGQSSWTEYDVLDAAAVNLVQTQGGIKATHFIGALGAPGLTAYYGLVDVAGAKAGETVLVSGAAGAVGSTVVQIAKHLVGAKRVIGIAGGEKKCRWVESLGADICIDYKAANFKRQLIDATHGFVDVFYDNVGGEILDLALTRVKRFGRVAACGAISSYNVPGGKGSITNWYEIISNRIEVRGFIIIDAIMAGKVPAIIGKLVEGIQAGKIKLGDESETVKTAKFEEVPKIWSLLFTGGNQGKLVTELKD
ncbi:quinone oxidoreductase [Paraconiothyrium brasiliense]|uniref:Quinone oxidoreductase n=1 Tax=Paraconiothyrium brasiliense TaxID=300254 RepID=A0ABR3QIR7_9PLEO